MPLLNFDRGGHLNQWPPRCAGDPRCENRDDHGGQSHQADRYIRSAAT
jgi:hypothetical protein